MNLDPGAIADYVRSLSEPQGYAVSEIIIYGSYSQT